MITTTALQTLLACSAVASVGGLAILVLPWTDEELDATEQAWRAVGSVVTATVAWARGLRPAASRVPAGARAAWQG